MERVAKLGDVDVAPLKLTFFPGLCESFYRSMKVINAGVCVCENWYNLCYLLSLFSRHFRVWMWQERGWKSVFWWLLSADIQEAKYSIQYFHKGNKGLKSEIFSRSSPHFLISRHDLKILNQNWGSMFGASKQINWEAANSTSHILSKILVEILFSFSILRKILL